MKKLFVFLLMIFTFVLALTSCQSESNLDEILAMPEFEGFSEQTGQDIQEFREKHWEWDVHNEEDGVTLISSEVMEVIRKSTSIYASFSPVNLCKYNEDQTEVQTVYGWEFSSASLAKKVMKQCPSLKALSEENPDVQYLYGNYILIKNPAKKSALASYPEVKAALLDKGFVVKESTPHDSWSRITTLMVAVDNQAVELYAQNLGFEKNIDGASCQVRVLRFNSTQYWEWAKPRLTEYLGEDYERYTYGECVLLPCDMQYAESVAAIVDALKQ